MWGLGSGPTQKKMKGFQSGPSLKSEGGRGLELKITKKRIFLKGGLLEQPRSKKWNKQMYIFEKGVQVKKEESLEAAQAEKCGAFGRHIHVLP